MFSELRAPDGQRAFSAHEPQRERLISARSPGIYSGLRCLYSGYKLDLGKSNGLTNLLFVPEQISLCLCNFNAVYQSAAFVLLTELQHL